ncbi:hypothetical protein ILUMI_12242 [Ignelater luminosus]|uniref:Ionotropic glutamate receptor C-terminal domain-containing protein n=1 Tax=Ignelater luminosus TaxID=2038154 RepID=A0A8K0D0P3_IGNLU|nr:hypothetical protein ILUMI_12242 [Ignelater luminosus]
MLNCLKTIGKPLGMKATFILTTTPKELMYKRSEDVYLLVGLTRDLQLLKDYDVSDCFFRDNTAWAVPIFEKSSIEVILTIFEWQVWLTIIAVLVGTTVIWWLLKRSKEHIELVSFQRSILSTFGMTLGGSTNILPKTNVLRILTIFYLLYSIEISQHFQGKLSSVLTHPGSETPISTVEELADSTLKIIGSEKISRMLLERKEKKHLKIQKRLIIRNNFNTTDNIITIAYFKNCSSIMGRKILQYAFPILIPKVHLIQDDSGLLEMELTFAMRKGHYFLDILNRFCSRITEAGIYQKMFSDTIAQSDKTTMIEKKDVKTIVLTIQHLMGLFFLWILGLTIATFVFISELCFHYRNFLR